MLQALDRTVIDSDGRDPGEIRYGGRVVLDPNPMREVQVKQRVRLGANLLIVIFIAALIAEILGSFPRSNVWCGRASQFFWAG